MRRILVLVLALGSCTSGPLADRPDGMLAPFPADAAGREVPYERMVPYLVEQSVALAVRRRPAIPSVDRADPLVDLRNEPVLVLGSAGAIGIGASWPQDREWTLRPPTRDELRPVSLEALAAGRRAADWDQALAWLRSEAERPRPGAQRFSGAVLIVADASTPAADVRAAASVLTTLGPVRHVRVAVRGPDGLWAARVIPPATLPVPALVELAAAARAAHPPAPKKQPANEAQSRLAAVLAQPIPGPKCIEVVVKSESEVGAAVAAVLPGAGPHDIVAVRGFEPTLDLYLHPERLVGSAAADRVRLGDACE